MLDDRKRQEGWAGAGERVGGKCSAALARRGQVCLERPGSAFSPCQQQLMLAEPGLTGVKGHTLHALLCEANVNV